MDIHQSVLFDYTVWCNLLAMDKFKTYFFDLDRAGRDEFASRCGTTRKHLTNVAYGYKPCGEVLAIAIERATSGAVTCEELRPDLAEEWSYLRNSRVQESIHAA